MSARSSRPSTEARWPTAAVVAKRNLIKIKRVPDLLVFTTDLADHVRAAVRLRLRRRDRRPAATSTTASS